MPKTLSIEDLFANCYARVDPLLKNYLINIPSLELKAAINYTLFNAGKRIRPALIYATGLCFDAPLENLDICAAAVETIHTYSLIHDDLPCMDNADLRRGKPTCHKAFNEGIAVLTGDALHSLAMQILSCHEAKLSSQKRLACIQHLSRACGPFGMAAGQALDITVMEDQNISHELLEEIYQLKTGALITASIVMGYICANDDDDFNFAGLKRFATYLGQGFQIQDDVFDIESTTTALGKSTGTDEKTHKMTYPKLFGLNEAKRKIEHLYEEALECINFLGAKAQLLRALTGYIFQRKN